MRIQDLFPSQRAAADAHPPCESATQRPACVNEQLQERSSKPKRMRWPWPKPRKLRKPKKPRKPARTRAPQAPIKPVVLADPARAQRRVASLGKP